MTTEAPTATEAAAPASAPADAPAASPAAPAPAPAAAPTKESLFSAAPAEAPAAAPAVDGAAPDWLPEKFRVMDGDKFDAEASSKKLAESYANLEKMKGTPTPAKAEDYTFIMPEQFKDVEMDPELTNSFRERAHKAGLSQQAYEFVMGEYFNLVPTLLNAAAGHSADQARAELSKVWGTPAELQSNMTAAERAVAAMPADLQEQIRTEFGTNATFWQFAAHFGKEVGEDRPVAPAGGQPTHTDTDALMRTEAYRNSKHPDHARVSAQVSAAFAKRAGDAPVMG